MDKTPPRNRLIALYSAIAVFTLLGLKPALDAYFDQMHGVLTAQGVDRGFVELEVLGELPDQARAAAEHALDGPRKRIRACVEERLSAGAPATGRAEARLRAANGVVSVQLENAHFNDPSIANCAQAALETFVPGAIRVDELRLGVVLAGTQADASELAWQQALATGPVTIADAKARLARGRMSEAAVRPQAGGEMNVDALRGWAELPQEVNLPAANAPAEGESAEETESTEGEPADEGTGEGANAPAPEANPTTEATE